MMSKKSNSVGHIDSTYAWAKENLAFFLMRLKGLNNKEKELTELLLEIDNYGITYEQITGHKLCDAKILEIGYGARPNRLILFMSLGYSIMGIDLDKPMLKTNLTDFISIYKKNGLKRFIKTFIRNIFFDRHERLALKQVLQKRDRNLLIDESKFLVGDAGSFEFPSESIDFIYSEDVFEHIPADAIHRLCDNLSRAITKDGLALFSPFVFTGISGNHLVEWYPHTLNLNMVRSSEPWEHLRKRRFHADCYLNELRVHDFEVIFKQYFDIVNVLNINPNSGKQYLTNEIKEELAEYSEAELLSDKWVFVLRRKSIIT
jgi:ubiquinone/menaquinone biosynthesis C-methylase UbiE